MAALVKASEQRFHEKTSSMDLGPVTIQPVSALMLEPLPYEDMKPAAETGDMGYPSSQLPSIKSSARGCSMGALEQVAVTGGGTAKNYDYDLMGDVSGGKK